MSLLMMVGLCEFCRYQQMKEVLHVFCTWCRCSGTGNPLLNCFDVSLKAQNSLYTKTNFFDCIRLTFCFFFSIDLNF